MAKKTNQYVPSPTVTSFLDVDRELRRIQESFSSLAEHVATEKSTESPDKLMNLQVRYADGVGWNPRGLGAGLYVYIDGVWRKITMT